MTLAVATLYYATPNVQQPKFRWISIGAGVAIITWIVASVLFGLYVAHFSSYNKTYGALAGVIVFLLWLWITNLALLFGAELDAELERGRQLQAGMPAERDLQLPARDTRMVKKNEAKDEQDLQRATHCGNPGARTTSPATAPRIEGPAFVCSPGRPCREQITRSLSFMGTQWRYATLLSTSYASPRACFAVGALPRTIYRQPTTAHGRT